MFKLESYTNPQQETIQKLEKVIKKDEQILYLNYANENLVSVCLSEDNLIIRQCSNQNLSEVFTKITQFQMKNNKIDYAFIDGDDGFLVYSLNQNFPLTLFYITKQQQFPIKLILNQSIFFKQCSIQKSNRSLFLYARKSTQQKRHLFQLNIDTLQIKNQKQQSNSNKAYTPGPHQHSFSIILDGRIYMFGGPFKNKECEKMIWIYDMEKGFWFALEMEYPNFEQIDFSQTQAVPLSTSKVLLRDSKKGRLFVLEVHQSRITQIIEGDFEKISGKLCCVNGDLVGYDQKGYKILLKKVVYYKKDKKNKIEH